MMVVLFVSNSLTNILPFRLKSSFQYIYTFSEVFKQIIYIFTYFVLNYMIILNTYSEGDHYETKVIQEFIHLVVFRFPGGYLLGESCAHVLDIVHHCCPDLYHS